jgi:hypothetical protein
MVELPLGFLGNPAAAERCAIGKLAPFFPNCPLGSKIGSTFLDVRGAPSFFPQPIWNVVPERGYAAEFATKVAGQLVVFYPTVGPRTDSYRLTVGTVDSPRAPLVTAAKTTFFGVPSVQNFSGGEPKPFLSNPVDCSQAGEPWNVAVDSWEESGAKRPDRTPDLRDPTWKTASTSTLPVTGCGESLLTSQFHPTVTATPVPVSGPVQADQPAGLSVNVDFPQSNDPTDPDTNFDPSVPQAPELKNITVKLPAGMSVSPSSADGLDGCSDRAADSAGDQVHYDNTLPVACPEASKIGTVTTTTPMLAIREPVTDTLKGPDPVGGSVYLIKPHPGDLSLSGDQDGTFRLLIVVESAKYGLYIKVPGTAVADKSTGQLTATFTENPQLPIKTLRVDLKSGARAPLATPATCGTFTTTTNMVPWSTPETPDWNPSSSFGVSSGPNGSGCANTPGARPFSPALSAGTESAGAGQSSPFVMRLTRNDGEQELSSLDVTMPKGFTAKLAGVPYCAEAAIAAAKTRSGAAEQANSSCPAASQIGSITAGAGPGTHPYYVDGKAYLAGPYKGAPLSLVFVSPAVAGPFDLGNVVVRAAAFLDPETAQVTVKTDPIPQILDGIPLRVRSIVARIDRPGFALNPTSCEAKSVTATVVGSSGATATPTNGFQVGGCDKLDFAPNLSLSVKGGTKRGQYQLLKAVLNAKPGEANIGKVAVTLPHSEFLAQEHIKTICTRVQYAAKQCPAGSVYGFAKAYTPLLDQPLEGPVYLRSSTNKLPDLVASLDGQIHVDVVGRIDSVKGGIRNTFEAIPDAPVSKFVLEMQGGKKSLLVNSRNICNSDSRATVEMEGQNGKLHNFRPQLKNSCPKKKKGKHSKKSAKSHGKH